MKIEIQIFKTYGYLIERKNSLGHQITITDRNIHPTINLPIITPIVGIIVHNSIWNLVVDL